MVAAKLTVTPADGGMMIAGAFAVPSDNSIDVSTIARSLFNRKYEAVTIAMKAIANITESVDMPFVWMMDMFFVR